MPEIETRSETLHERLTDLTYRLRQLDNGLSMVTSAICGNVPEGADTQKRGSGDNHLHNKLSDSIAYVSSLECELNRLQCAVGMAQPELEAKCAQGKSVLNSIR